MRIALTLEAPTAVVALVRRLTERGIFVVPVRGAVRIALCAVATPDVERLVDALTTRRTGERRRLESAA